MAKLGKLGKVLRFSSKLLFFFFFFLSMFQLAILSVLVASS